jgi:hypothetical protein
MQKTLTIAFALFLGLFLSFSVAFAQDKPADPKAKPDRIQGVVQSVNKETSTINVKDSKTGLVRAVVFSDATKYTKVNQPGSSLDDLKMGTRVICLGKFDDKARLVAARIDIRLPK